MLASPGVRLDEPQLVERLATHKTIAGAPREELEWLAANGEVRRYEAGDPLALRTERALELVLILSGRIAGYADRGTGRRHVDQSTGGGVGGVLPYSRLVYPQADVFAEETSDLYCLHRDRLPEMIRECPFVTAALVHAMIDRVRRFAATDWQDDKIVALGRLAAGIAHELNNPASAAAQSARSLSDALRELSEASQALGAASLTESQRALVASVRDSSLVPATTGVFSAIERSDREDEICGWLAARNADVAPAAALVESGVTLESLEALARHVPAHTFDAALRAIAAEYSARSLAVDVERATTRIYDLVSAVKRFTYMDRATVPEPSHVGQGLTDTVAVLAAKAKARRVGVQLDIAPDLPLVPVYVAEMNQVWSNLIHNALDAVGEDGKVTVSAKREGNDLVVRVVDNGPGIPAAVLGRIFDPFFTTKPIGQGTGLGLDIARRIVRGHEGQIDVESRPEHTEFRVTIPASRTAAVR